MSRPTKCLVTHVTFVWFLSTVKSAVANKMSSLCESFVTNNTFKWFLSRMPKVDSVFAWLTTAGVYAYKTNYFWASVVALFNSGQLNSSAQTYSDQMLSHNLDCYRNVSLEIQISEHLQKARSFNVDLIKPLLEDAQCIIPSKKWIA